MAGSIVTGVVKQQSSFSNRKSCSCNALVSFSFIYLPLQFLQLNVE